MHLRNLYNIRESLNLESRTLLVTNLIISTIDYCNILLIGCNAKELKPLKLIMNRCIRFIITMNFRRHVSPFYKKLHFLPIKKRIEFKACLMAYKIFYSEAPEYLSAEFQHFIPQLEMTLRREVGRDDYMFDTQHDSFKFKQIYFQVRQQWNALPLRLRECDSISVFKKRLKTKLFSEL